MAQSPGRDAVFDRIFDLYHEPVQRYCLRRLPVDEMNDAVAEVFLVAWRRIAGIPDDMELPWLYGIARNVVRNANRTRHRRARLHDRMAAQPGETNPDPEAQLVRHYEDLAVLEALATLRDEDQEILRLKTWEELSNDAIAATVGVSVRAIDMRLTRARKRLAKAYDKHERRAFAATRGPRLVNGGGER